MAHQVLYATDAPYYVGLPENGPRHKRSTTYAIIGVVISVYVILCSGLVTAYLRRLTLLAKLHGAPST